MGTNSFFHINIGHVFELLSFIIAALVYRSGRIKTHNDQLSLHIENQQKLNAVLEFNKLQVEINQKRDQQLAQISIQTATLLQIAQGLDRRITILEDAKVRNKRSQS